MKKIVLKINEIFKIIKYNSYFERKSNLFVFLLLLLGVLIPTLSGSPTSNFWYKLFNILTSPFFNMMFFLSLGIDVIYISGELSKTYNIVNRYSSYEKLIKRFINNIIVSTVTLFIVSIILAIAGAIIFSFGDFSMLKHPYYDISIIFYIFLFLFRSCVFACIINIVIYLLFIILRKISTIIVIITTNSFFLIMPSSISKIAHFYNMQFLYHYYFSIVNYSSLFLEIICSLFQLIILFVIYKLLYKFVVSKKRDML